MHLQCRKALIRIAVTPWAPKDRRSGKYYGGQWTCRTRSYSGFPALDTNTGHPQPYARRTIGYPTTPLPQLNDTLASARRRSMEEPINLKNTLALYDWRAFAPAGTQLYYIRSEGDANQRIARIASRPGPFTIGLDFEWRPTFVARRPENPIALVQLACDDEILLVQVSAMSAFPSRLRDLLESAESTKVGVGIQYDCIKLWKDHQVSVRNCVDLALLARSVDPQWKGPYKGGIGLSRLAETYLQRKLPKGGIQRSNWEMELSTSQQEYAANDSHASLTIYRELVRRLRAVELDPAPEPDCFTFNAMKGILRDDEGRPWFPINPLYDSGLPPKTASSEPGTAFPAP